MHGFVMAGKTVSPGRMHLNRKSLPVLLADPRRALFGEVATIQPPMSALPPKADME